MEEFSPRANWTLISVNNLKEEKYTLIEFLLFYKENETVPIEPPKSLV